MTMKRRIMTTQRHRMTTSRHRNTLQTVSSYFCVSWGLGIIYLSVPRSQFSANLSILQTNSLNRLQCLSKWLGTPGEAELEWFLQLWGLAVMSVGNKCASSSFWVQSNKFCFYLTELRSLSHRYTDRCRHVAPIRKKLKIYRQERISFLAAVGVVWVFRVFTPTCVSAAHVCQTYLCQQKPPVFEGSVFSCTCPLLPLSL